MQCVTYISGNTTECGQLDTGGKVGVSHCVVKQGGQLWQPVKFVETITICLLR